MFRNSLTSQWLTCSFAVAICSALPLWPATAQAQEQIAPAVIALRIDVTAILNDELVKPIRDVAEKNLEPSQTQMLEVTDRLTSISAQIAAPEEITPTALTYTDFFITLTFASAEVAQDQYKKLDGFEDADIDGKAYKQTGGEFGIPLILARLNETSIDIGSKNYITSGKRNFASPALVAAYRQLPQAAIRMAADLESAKPIVGQAVDVLQETADPLTKELIRPLRHLKTVQLHLDLHSATMLGLTAETFEAGQAEGMKNKLDSVLGLARNMLRDAPDDMVKTFAESMLSSTKIAQSDTRASVQISKPANLEAQMQKLVEGAQASAKRVENQNKFKLAGLAMHNFADFSKQFPFEPSERRQVHKDLSWRVALLPFLEQAALYNKFDPQSGWDSAQNKPLAEQTPPVFTLSNGSGISWIRPEKPPGYFSEITDGTSNTVCLVENPDAGKQPWTKPNPLTVAQAVKLVQSQPDGKVLLCLTYDGAVHSISNKTDAETLTRFFTPNDGKPLDYKKIRLD